MGSNAYALTDEYAGSFDGGVFGLADGREVDLAKELEAGGGRIFVPDEDVLLNETLRGIDCLEAADAAGGPPEKALKQRTKDELVALASDAGLDTEGLTKPQLVEALEDLEGGDD